MGDERREKLLARNAHRHELTRGFTLAETLIALGISSLIAVALVSVFSVTLAMKSAVAARITERVMASHLRAAFGDIFRGATSARIDGGIIMLTPADESVLLSGKELIWKKRRPYGIPRTVVIASNVSLFSPRIERGVRMDALIISLQAGDAAVEYTARFKRRR